MVYVDTTLRGATMVCLMLFIRRLDCFVVLTRCQFHQHFPRAFFVRKSFLAAFSSYVLPLAKNSYEKIACKMLTVGVNFINILHAPFSYKRALHSFSFLTVWLSNLLGKKYWCKSCS